jgi:hypothetical protein
LAGVDESTDVGGDVDDVWDQLEKPVALAGSDNESEKEESKPHKRASVQQKRKVVAKKSRKADSDDDDSDNDDDDDSDDSDDDEPVVVKRPQKGVKKLTPAPKVVAATARPAKRAKKH